MRDYRLREGYIPNHLQAFLRDAIERLSHEPWLVGVMATGSYVAGDMDAYSDLDLVLIIEEETYSKVLGERKQIAEYLGPLLSAFTGEHIGQSHLLLCLYGPPLLQAELAFTSISDLARTPQRRIVLWQRDNRLNVAHPQIPRSVSPQWIEDRFWYWVQKARGKIARGELFEAINYLCFFRSNVLGPLALHAAGKEPYGVKKIEVGVPEVSEKMKATLAGHNSAECRRALRATVDLYLELRSPEGPDFQYRKIAEAQVTASLAIAEA